jgi:hypothetical protein
MVGTGGSRGTLIVLAYPFLVEFARFRLGESGSWRKVMIPFRAAELLAGETNEYWFGVLALKGTPCISEGRVFDAGGLVAKVGPGISQCKAER